MPMVGISPVRAMVTHGSGLREYGSARRQLCAHRFVDARSEWSVPALRRPPAETACALLVPPSVKRRRRDLEIGVLGKSGPEIRVQTLFRDHFVCAVREGHPLLGAGEITAERYAACGHVVASRRGHDSGPVDEALRALGLTRTVVAEYDRRSKSFRHLCGCGLTSERGPQNARGVVLAFLRGCLQANSRAAPQPKAHRLSPSPAMDCHSRTASKRTQQSWLDWIPELPRARC